MKALILAAGFGTRLAPFTQKTPKPLFQISNRPLLDIIICDLQQAGCTEIMVNTHHLHNKIETFIAEQEYQIPVNTIHEPEILHTGGAIKNLEHFWDDRPFMVINSDIVTDIDLKRVYQFHLGHNHHATLVLHDFAEFNKVPTSKDGYIQGFDIKELPKNTVPDALLAFTGIQVLDPLVLDFIPEKTFYSSIDAFRKMIAAGSRIKAFIPKNAYWQDMGTPEKYQKAVFDKIAPIAFEKAYPTQHAVFRSRAKEIVRTKLKGDGSDRVWYRLCFDDMTVIMADHGIQEDEATSEIDSFVDIGRHLYQKGVCVPKTHFFEKFAGLIFLEDLGDESLQAFVLNKTDKNDIISAYKTVIDQLIRFSVDGAEGFDLSWTYQTATYSKDLIIEKECRYFTDAFLNRYLGMAIEFRDLEDEFACLAKNALKSATIGFMHRDMQSRNIMVDKGQFYFIDFQAGRIGPIQYDLASLLIDPYVELSETIQDQLLAYCLEKLSSTGPVNEKHFFQCYRYCSLTRNLQMLGAFGFLSKAKGKAYFETFIPAALNKLNRTLDTPDGLQFPKLKSIVEKAIAFLPSSDQKR